MFDPHHDKEFMRLSEGVRLCELGLVLESSKEAFLLRYLESRNATYEHCNTNPISPRQGETYGHYWVRVGGKR